MELLSTRHYGPELENLLLKGERLIWTSDLETLKTFVEETIQQHGKWSSPGGSTKSFKSDNNRLTITWYGGKQSTLSFQGKDGPLLKEQLVNLIQRNEAQKPVDDADSHLSNSNSTVLQSSNPEPFATDGHGCPENLVSNIQNMSFNDTSSHTKVSSERCHGCTSLDSKLHQLRVYFQSEIDTSNEKVLNCPANRQNSSPHHDDISPDVTELQKENQDLQRKLREIESKYENLKTEVKIINDENKSLITALRLSNNEFSPQDSNNLHPTPGEGVKVINNQHNCDTSAAFTVVSSKQTKGRPISQRSRNQKNQSKEPPKESTASEPENRGTKDFRSTFIAGDSILKHLNSRSMSGPNSKVQVSSFPGCTTKDMADHIRPIVRRKPGSIIIHVGTNSLRNSNSSRECADEIVDIGRMVDQEGISVTISSLTPRADDNELAKRVKEVNKILRKFCRQNQWGFIDHNNITYLHLKRSRLHLNRSGTSLLSQNFISYINGQ